MARRRNSIIWLCVGAMAAWPGCSDVENSSGDRTTMKMSAGRYNQGYKDGMRDAKASLFEDSGGWMWLWMVEKEYQDGYDRGWSDGRQMVRLQNQKNETDALDAEQREEQE
ncbi:MAG TPA: hypothetical protein VJZ71_19130 [Phycisphaerae bacterium]|nr:hypothetical protein [Phycisphaerae bacterium]